MKSYIVGGWVRDKVAGQPSSDKDWVVVGATPNDLLKEGFQQVGASFPVFLHPKTHQEYALARREKKQGVGYHGFSVDFGVEVSLEEDLLRRDLTINAMAFCPNTSQIIDPHGGQSDLKNHVLRHVSPAFVEDPLRVIRLARFHSLFPTFSIDEQLMQYVRQLIDNGEMRTLAKERVCSEFLKAHQSNYVPKLFWQHCLQWGLIKQIFDCNSPPWPVFQSCIDKYGPFENINGNQVLLALYLALFQIAFYEQDNVNEQSQSLLKPFFGFFSLFIQRQAQLMVDCYLLSKNWQMKGFLDYIQKHRLLHAQKEFQFAFDLFLCPLTNEQALELIMLLRSLDKKEILSQNSSLKPKQRLEKAYIETIKASRYANKFS